jgi:hypothetical protein
MKRAILLTLAAGVATLPALWGVTGNTTFGQSVPAAIPSGASVAPSVDDRRSAPSAGSTADDRGRDGKGSNDSATSSGPTAAATSDDHRGRGSDDAATSSQTQVTTETATSGDRTTSTKATTATVDDKGGSTQSSGDSGHGGKSGSGKG